MISTQIKISLQEVIDFPIHTLQCDDKWRDIINPENDDEFRRKRTNNKKHKIICDKM